MKKVFRIIKNDLACPEAFRPLWFRIEQRYTILFFIHWWGTPTFAPPHNFEYDCDALKYIKQHYPNAIVCDYHSEKDSLQKEPVSEDLEKAAKHYLYSNILYDDVYVGNPTDKDCIEMFKAGAYWQKEQLWKPADGDDLPEYDREVIAILDYDFGHYKVVYAHRPNPNGWNGTNIDTEEKEHFEPEIYDKGGWNQPHVLYWLDTILPCEEK